MSTISQLRGQIAGGSLDDTLMSLYCTDADGAAVQKARYLEAIRQFEGMFSQRDGLAIFSAPGRTEVGGNHTDHQHGCVLAASVNLDVIAVAAPRPDSVITVKSEGFDADRVDISDLTPQKEETGRSAALIRGVCEGFVRRGFRIGAFDAYTTSNVLKGSGLSSSAAFEVLIGTILNHLYNDGTIDAVVIAQIAQFAEREYFGKPCGLMDQTASSVGGFVAIDFEDPQKPAVRQIGFRFSDCGHHLVIVDTRGDHADLTEDYAAIGDEMRSVAAHFGQEVLRGVDPAAFYAELGRLKGTVSDRALLRAMHFFAENDLAQREAETLEAGDFDAFKRQVLSSGRSSFCLLQNVFSTAHPERQEIPLALALSEQMLAGRGAWRVHGGGFAGTIQAFVPVGMTADYCRRMEAVFGAGCCYVLSVRPVGAVRLI
ncbi:MAG: galactokinase family protein [Firmicutes bacterium]|nr:galactokinase family protein [Bacillota bacterium]